MSLSALTLQLTQYLMKLGFLVLPFWFWPTAAVPFEVPKVTATLTWITLLGSLSTLHYLFTKKSPRLQPTLFLGLTLFCSLACLTSVLGVNFQKSIFGNPYRHDGLLTIVALIGFAVIVARTLTAKNYRQLVTPIALSSLVLSGIAVLMYLAFHLLEWSVFPDWQGAVGATFGQPNFLAGYLLVSFPITYFVASQFLAKQPPIWLWLILSMQGLGIAVTYSLGAIGGVGLLAILGAGQRFTALKYRLAGWIICLCAALIGFMALVYLQAQQAFIFESRPRIFAHLLTAIHQRPWLGWGVANIDYAFRTSALQDKFQHDVYVDKAHSELLEVTVTNGLLGGLIYLSIAGLVIQQLWPGIKKGSPSHLTSMFVVLLYLFHAQTNVISISEQLLFWFVIGHALQDSD